MMVFCLTNPVHESPLVTALGVSSYGRERLLVTAQSFGLHDCERVFVATLSFGVHELQRGIRLEVHLDDARLVSDAHLVACVRNHGAVLVSLAKDDFSHVSCSALAHC